MNAVRRPSGSAMTPALPCTRPNFAVGSTRTSSRPLRRNSESRRERSPPPGHLGAFLGFASTPLAADRLLRGAGRAPRRAGRGRSCRPCAPVPQRAPMPHRRPGSMTKIAGDPVVAFRPGQPRVEKRNVERLATGAETLDRHGLELGPPLVGVPFQIIDNRSPRRRQASAQRWRRSSSRAACAS